VELMRKLCLLKFGFLTAVLVNGQLKDSYLIAFFFISQAFVVDNDIHFNL
jgi:hypothetical protein